MDHYSIMDQANARLEYLFWVPGVVACSTPPDSFSDLVDDLLDECPCTSSLLACLPEIKGVMAMRDEDTTMTTDEVVAEICAALGYARRAGFIFQVAVPVTHKHQPDGSYSFTWGYYRTTWHYAETLEEMVVYCQGWAAAQREHDMQKGAT